MVNVYGGGNNGTIENAKVNLKGGIINNVYGGSNSANATKTTVNVQGGTPQSVYGGCNISGTCNNANIDITSGNVTSAIYGGNNAGGYTKEANITINGENLVLTGKIYGGGNKAEIGKGSLDSNNKLTIEDKGNVNISIINGTIKNDVNGGSKESIVYGDTKINIGKNENTTNVQSKIVKINGNIFGCGDSNLSDNANAGNNFDYNYVSSYGNVDIKIDANNYQTFSIDKSIFGSGNAAKNSDDYKSNIYINNFGTNENIKKIVSVQRANGLYIGNSNIEFAGILNACNYYKKVSYALNRIDNLTIYANTKLYMKRGYNIVKSFNSLVDLNGEKENIEISKGKATTNGVDNRLYVLDGVNLIFATQEGKIYDSTTSDTWGTVNGMTFFGLYTYKNGILTKDIYDDNYQIPSNWQTAFYSSSYVEAKNGQNPTEDGFYTNQLEQNGSTKKISQEYIPNFLLGGGLYYDWLIGEKTTTYDTTLMASIYSKETMSSIELTEQYNPGTLYSIAGVDVSRLKEGTNLINSENIPDIADEVKNEDGTITNNANTTFGLTIQTADSGWTKSEKTNLYTAENGSMTGSVQYTSDQSGEVPVLNIKMKNSTNITLNQDLGTVRVTVIGKNMESGEEDTSRGTFIMILNINLSTLFNEDEFKYMPSFTDKNQTKLTYTNDSTIDLTYKLYKRASSTVYEDGDYRDISSTLQLPVGTKITMIDCGLNNQQDTYYYYEITSSNGYAYTTKYTYEDGTEETRYIYKFNNFVSMGNSDGKNKFTDDNTRYYKSDTGYAYEKFIIQVDLSNTTISSNQINQHIYMELRNKQNEVKYDQIDEEITFDLLKNKNAIMTEEISNAGQEYMLLNTLEIPFVLQTSLNEQYLSDGTNIIDSKYYSRNLGMAIEIVNAESGKRLKMPQLSTFNLIVTDRDGEKIYTPDAKGVIRLSLSDVYATIEKNMKLQLQQNYADTGKYKVKIYVFASDDGLYYGAVDKLEKEFNINIFSSSFGFKVDIDNSNRTFYSKTSEDLLGNKKLTCKLLTESKIENGSIKVVLYKRNATYTGDIYNDVSYTEVDFAKYFRNELNQYAKDEYIISDSVTQNQTINFEGSLKSGISTGEYKLEFKLYSGNICVQRVEKTFIVISS